MKKPNRETIVTIFLWILAGLILFCLIPFPVHNMRRHGEVHRKARVQKNVTELCTALASYHLEYKRFPDLGLSEEPVPTSTDNPLISILLDKEKAEPPSNPRGVLFFSSHPAKFEGSPGYWEPEAHVALFCRYSSPDNPRFYYVVLDHDGDGKIVVPDRRGEMKKVLSERVAAWSWGKDGKPGGRDDITSW